MSEVFVTFRDPVRGQGNERFVARACGGPLDDELWQGWIEFVPLDGSEPFQTGRETTQSNLADLTYWATGLTPVYLEGALDRARNPGSLRKP